jgi:uncharacterized protein (TIGR00255 family)
MILSMTGFGCATAECLNKKFTVEVKSLNSKQLDLTLRLPQGYRQVETEVRNIVAPRLERGKSELNAFVETISGEAAARLNVEAMADYKRQIIEAAKQLCIPKPTDWYSVLFRMPDVIKAETPAEAGEPEKQALLECVRKAVEELMEHRAAEGRRLDEFFRERIRRISALLDEVPRYESERITKIRNRIADNLASIPKVDYDKGRLEQEMIYYIEKLDINEEKQRLAQHLRYFLETLDEEPGQGKKLGFISQEMGREINTLGSKSNQADMQILVVKMKDELEQIKEQVLNVM